jgi:hypothetical protein
MSFVAMISSKSNKRIKQAIWKGNANVKPGNVHALVLMLLATNILSITAPCSSTQENNVLLKSVQFSLTKKLPTLMISSKRLLFTLTLTGRGFLLIHKLIINYVP